MRAAEQQASALVTQVDAEFKTVQDGPGEGRRPPFGAGRAEPKRAGLQRQFVQRVEAEAARRLETATEQAIDGLNQAHEAQLAELKTWASEAQAELEQTRAALVGAGAVWTRPWPAVQALTDLDQYAANPGGPVRGSSRPST